MSVLAFAAIVAAGCAGDDMTSSNGGDDPGDGGGVTGDVSVRNDFFDPATVTRSPGSNVVWAWNSGGTQHNVTFEDGMGSSATQGSGTHSRTFASAGTFRYRCTIHSGDFDSGMVGSVEVQ
jgi:plastocyanin